MIEGLPLNDDEQFQVSETDPDIANMTTTWAKDNGSPEEGLVAEPVTLDETDVPQITFTNSLETATWFLIRSSQVKLVILTEIGRLNLRLMLRLKTLKRANGRRMRRLPATTRRLDDC